jgi:hypothetical protein
MDDEVPFSALYAKLLATPYRASVNSAIRKWFSYDKGADDLEKVIPVLTLRAAANSNEGLLAHLLAFENVNAQDDPQRILRYFDAVLTGTPDFNQFPKGRGEMQTWTPYHKAQRWSLRHICRFFPEFDMDTVNKRTGKTLLETAAGIPGSKLVIYVLINFGATNTDATAQYALEKKCYDNVRALIPGTMQMKRKRDVGYRAATAAATEDAPPAKKQRRSFNF